MKNQSSVHFGIIGYGKLGSAFTKGLVGAGISENNIYLTARSEDTKNKIRNDFPESTVCDSKEVLVSHSDIIFLIVEPANAYTVIQELNTCDVTGKVIVSLMAGITRRDISDMFGNIEHSVPIIRIMPNIAIAENNGVIGISYDDSESELVNYVVQVMGKLGYLLRLKESELETVTVTAASGIAIAASLMNSYQIACNQLFHDEKKSLDITLKVFENLIHVMKNEEITFKELMNRIATKGGTTEAGILHLDQETVTQTLCECMQASYEKASNILK